MKTALEIHTIVSQPFAESSYVIWLPGRHEAVVIDPGLEPELILDFFREQQLAACTILNTHGHADHIGGNAALKEAFPAAPLVIGANEVECLSDSWANLSALFGSSVISPPADRTVVEGDIVEAGGIRLEVLDVPGHSAGHVAYLFRNDPCLLFSGDVLFRGGIGRSDFPRSDGRLLYESIRDKVFGLPPTTVVYPGHGPTTTVGHEMQFNRLVRE